MEIHSVEMLEVLKNQILNGKKSLVSSRVSIEKNDALELIKELESVLPEEIKEANTYYKESLAIKEDAIADANDIVGRANVQAENTIREAEDTANRIIADANAEAEAIIREAQAQQAQMIQENRITQLANEQAREILEQAKAREAEIQRATKQYLEDRLNSVSTLLAKTYNEIEKNKKTL